MSVKSAEHRLLIVTARVALNPKLKRSFLDLAAQVGDWQYLIDMAKEHAVIPLLWRHLSGLPVDIVPTQVIDQIGTLNETNTNYALYLTGVLTRLLEVFENHGIHAIPFKGPILAIQAYGDVGLRQFADLDVLVRQEQLGQAADLLADHGFHPEYDLSLEQESAACEFDCALNFRNERNVLIDLHWKFVPKYLSLNFEPDLLEPLQSIQVGNRKHRTLSSVDTIIVLAIHGFTHYWERIGWIADLTALFENNPPDWSALMRKAQQLDLRRVVAVAMLLCHQLLDATLPNEILKELHSDKVARRLADKFQRTMLSDDHKSSSIVGVMDLHVRMRERVSDKLWTLFRFAFTPRITDLAISPRAYPVGSRYYLTRFVRLAGKGAAGLAGGSRRASADTIIKPERKNTR